MGLECASGGIDLMDYGAAIVISKKSFTRKTIEITALVYGSETHLPEAGKMSM